MKGNNFLNFEVLTASTSEDGMSEQSFPQLKLPRQRQDVIFTYFQFLFYCS